MTRIEGSIQVKGIRVSFGAVMVSIFQYLSGAFSFHFQKFLEFITFKKGKATCSSSSSFGGKMAGRRKIKVSDRKDVFL